LASRTTLRQEGCLPKDNRNQAEKFREAARQLGCDESEEAFDRALRKVVKREPKKPAKPDEAAD
jgi:hypothetical protein